MLCHSVFSWRSPDALSFHTSSVAIEKRQNGVPLEVYLSSGSLPSLPIRITLFTDFAIQLLNRFSSSPARGFWARRWLEFLEFRFCSCSFASFREPLYNISQCVF